MNYFRLSSNHLPGLTKATKICRVYRSDQIQYFDSRQIESTEKTRFHENKLRMCIQPTLLANESISDTLPVVLHDV